MSGNKGEVLEKLADGFALGAIPRCPHCFGGRPKFNKSNGTYKCPGFRDDVDYKFCNKTFAFEEITREKWIEWFNQYNLDIHNFQFYQLLRLLALDIQDDTIHYKIHIKL